MGARARTVRGASGTAVRAGGTRSAALAGAMFERGAPEERAARMSPLPSRMDAGERRRGPGGGRLVAAARGPPRPGPRAHPWVRTRGARLAASRGAVGPFLRGLVVARG